MTAVKGLAVRLRALLRRRAANRELDEEIRFHIERETEKNIRSGMSPEEARRCALVAFGGVQRTREAHRDVRSLLWAEEFFADIRFALRSLRKSPTIAVAAILTLALGVGANTAIFSAVNAVILRPLPFPAPGRLMMLWEQNPEKGWYQQTVAPANYLDWKEQVAAFQDVAAYTDGAGSVTLTGEGAPRLLRAAQVTGNLFDVLRVRAEIGRTLRDAETWKTGAHVAVLSDRVWRDQFGGDAGIIGRTIQLDGQPLQVVGVLPSRFAFPSEDVDVWIPTAWDPANRAQVWFRRAHWLRAVARLDPGVSEQQANAQLQQVVERLKRQYPETNRVMGAGMTPLHQFLIGDTRLPLLVLLGAVALLLLIACANVGNLLLVQAAGREREAALRLALGAGRGRLVRQALTESLVLSVLGGAAGLVLGWWGTRALVALQPTGMLPVRDVSVSWSVLGYVLAITTASGLLFGIAPALWSGRRAPVEALKDGGRTGSDGRRMRQWGDALVIGEVALALLLTVGAGLLVHSFWRLQQVDPGFDPDGVLAVSLDLPGTRYDTDDKTLAFYDQLVQRVRTLSGVSEAAAVLQPPLTGTAWTSDFAVAGRPPGEYGTEIAHEVITPGYFHLMRIPVRSGRTFTAADRDGTAPVVIINDVLAARYFRGQRAVGQRITFDQVPDSNSVWRTIVGVVGSSHQTTLAVEPKIEVYVPAAQSGDNQTAMTVLARTTADPASLAPAMRRVVAEMDPNLAITHMRTMASVRSTSLARPRFLTTLLLVFAGVGLVLAVVGVYGVMAQLARRRTREMGIRIALGAQSSHVQWIVVRHGLRLVSVGVVIGAGAALVATRAMRALLYHVAPADPVTFIAVPIILAATAVVATWLPAMQANRADPASTLRAE